MNEDVLVSVTERVLRVTINRPEKRNPLSRAVLARLREVFHGHHDADLVLAVVTGAGEQSFAAGGDLKDLEQVRTMDEARGLFDLGNGAMHAIRTFPVPVVAALNGYAIGGGAELAISCDVRIAAAHARMGFVQGNLNISPAWGGGNDLCATLGPAIGLELLATSRIVDAPEAKAIGLFNAVAPEGEPFPDFVERWLAPWKRQKPQVMRAFKWNAAARKLGIPRSEMEPRDREHVATAWCHDDHWAAAKDILKKAAKP